MDTLVMWILLILLLMQGSDVVGGPFLIGTYRKPYSAAHWLFSVIVFGALLVVAGYVWGWW